MRQIFCGFEQAFLSFFTNFRFVGISPVRYNAHNVIGCPNGRIGNPVKVRSGPATVIGETHQHVTAPFGVGRRCYDEPKPGDLPN